MSFWSVILKAWGEAIVIEREVYMYLRYSYLLEILLGSRHGNTLISSYMIC